mgnify:FL=1|tara:strand:+ start:145 stop:540 length:396 start_codon:yes stop_codon:yes gene_type:complete
MNVEEARSIIFIEMMKLKMQRQAPVNFENYMLTNFNREFKHFVKNVYDEEKHTPVENCEFNARVRGIFKAENIYTMEHLEHLYNAKSDYGTRSLLKVPNLGRGSLKEIGEGLECWRKSKEQYETKRTQSSI